MATVFRRVGGRKIEDWLAEDLDVQVAVGRYAFEIKAYADAYLIEARDFSLMIGRHIDFDVFVHTEKSPGQGQDSGWNVVLNDLRGDEAAYNIERGRKPTHTDPVTLLPRGQMEGLELLEQAIQAVADRHRSELRGG